MHLLCSTFPVLCFLSGWMAELLLVSLFVAQSIPSNWRTVLTTPRMLLPRTYWPASTSSSRKTARRTESWAWGVGWHCNDTSNWRGLHTDHCTFELSLNCIAPLKYCKICLNSLQYSKRNAHNSCKKSFFFSTESFTNNFPNKEQYFRMTE